MASERLWQRPPDNYCSRCAELVTRTERVTELTCAFGTLSKFPGDEAALAVITKAGGDAKAHAEIRDANTRLPDLRKHARWKRSQRKYVKQREVQLQAHELMWYLDYGGFTDSTGRKVNCWGATILAPGHAQEHFDVFFDAKNQAAREEQPGFKKDGQAGIFFLAELLDPARDPTGTDRSLIAQKFPAVTHIILSGDTGNGFRGYEMLEELSKVATKYNFSVELVNLAPGHAFNRTDARIAHINTYLRKLLRKTRVFGAFGLATALRAASMKRSNVFFRVVEGQEDREKKRKNLGAQIQSKQLVGGKVGVRGLLYFDFRLEPGYAIARQYGDPGAVDNPSFVYTWKKDEAKKMCQTCSDRAQKPVMKAVLACTSKKCNGKASLRLVAPQEQNAFPLGRADAAPVADIDAAADDALLAADGGNDDAAPASPPRSPVEIDNDKEEDDGDEFDANDTDALTDVDEQDDKPDHAVANVAASPPPAAGNLKKNKKRKRRNSSSSQEDNTSELDEPEEDTNHDETPTGLDHADEMSRADWISSRLERPFGPQNAGLRETPYERAAREYDQLTSGSSRPRRMGARAMSACRGSLVSTLRESTQTTRRTRTGGKKSNGPGRKGQKSQKR
jgi:hypothetical protein